MKESIIVDITNQGKVIFKSGGTIEELIQKIDGPNTIIAALIDNEVQELSYRIKDDTKLTFIHINERMGAKIYRSGLKFLYIAAIKELYGANTNVELKHSLDKGIYTRIDLEITEKHVEDIKAKMHELSKRNLKIEKLTTNRKEAIKYYESSKEQEKVDIYKQMTRDVVTLYSLLDYYGYYYSKMPISTGILNNFDLTLTNDKGIILQYPNTHDGIIPPYTHMEDVLNVFKSYGSWSTRLGVNYVSEVNNIIINGKIKEFIQLNEIRQNEDLQTIAYEIKTKINELKLVLIAGPSSSGKTTTSKKLSLYLKNLGINPFVISTDDYFKNRTETPKNEKGEYEYDILEAIDVDLFNNHLTKLLNGEEITIPTYNFLTGEKEYKNNPISLKNRDVIIIEGIHTLNEELTKSIERKNKYKIYISPFTPLGLDRHNHISTVDLRLIRRLVRDYRTRGYSAEGTLKGWQNVRISEEKYIFPYQKEADKVLDTALIYELGILKTYAIPILYSVNYKSKYYSEALRIINFLEYFLNIPVDTLPNTALLREFVGNGYFE
ncbi:MAG: nucleoside kinase [Bacilli bacterium]|nr:nucleoside kinase [Bacilli bacterium]